MDEVLSIIRQWQDPGTWQTVVRLEQHESTLTEQASELGRDARFWLDRGNVCQSNEMRMQSKHYRDCAGTVREQRNELIRQFLQIENWIREHRPDLLEFVPTATFNGDSSEAIRDLKRLESQIRKPAVKTPPGQPGQIKNKIAQPDDVAEFYRLRQSSSWQGKSNAAIHAAIAQANAKKINIVLTSKALDTEKERIKKAIRDYEAKVKRQE